MRLFKGMLVAACAAFFVACGGGSPADKVFSHQEKVFSLIEANKADLDKAAKEVEAYISANKDAIKADGKAFTDWLKGLDEKDPAVVKIGEELQKKGESIEARIKALETEIPAFKDHEGLKKAKADLGALFGGL